MKKASTPKPITKRGKAKPREFWIGWVHPNSGVVVMDVEPGELALHFKTVIHVREVPPKAKGKK